MDKRPEQEDISAVGDGLILWRTNNRDGVNETYFTREQAERFGVYNLGYSQLSARRIRFHRIGHALWTVIIGCAAGSFAYWCRNPVRPEAV